VNLTVLVEINQVFFKYKDFTEENSFLMGVKPRYMQLRWIRTRIKLRELDLWNLNSMREDLEHSYAPIKTERSPSYFKSAPVLNEDSDTSEESKPNNDLKSKSFYIIWLMHNLHPREFAYWNSYIRHSNVNYFNGTFASFFSPPYYAKMYNFNKNNSTDISYNRWIRTQSINKNLSNWNSRVLNKPKKVN